MIRLFVPNDLTEHGRVALGAEQAHYLRDVMRRSAGDEILVFNGRDGEWRAEVAAVERKAAALVLRAQTRAQPPAAALELVVALVKRGPLETIVEKAVELGVGRIRLCTTRFTQGERVNLARLGAIAVEAAEQTGRLDVPEIVAPAKLDAILAAWPNDRTLAFCDEAGGAPLMSDALATARAGGVLIGPVGGFSAEERAHLRGLSFVTPVSLGPRVLRADTAAIAALALWQSTIGDWRP